ncbi:hypothetical protein HUG17_2342 [Dermatophagoides farinae]|uniref:Uncharacterized protein n=1 Tax=Dermatophagoides farinae TaxID=6954 RepID=A0A9D4PB33_DERFA|nr:hypothetical protein HUG17_2342 [Dermatophagoides farinae]
MARGRGEAIKHHMDEFDAGKLSTHGFEDLKNMIKQIRNIQQEFPSVTNRHQPIIGKYNHIETVINQINAERSTRRPQSPPRVSTPIIELLSNSGNNTDQPNQFPPLWTNHIRWNPRPGAISAQSHRPIESEDGGHHTDTRSTLWRQASNNTGVDKKNSRCTVSIDLKDYEGLLEVVISVVDTLKDILLRRLGAPMLYKIDEIHHQHIGNEYELNLNDIEKNI